MMQGSNLGQLLGPVLVGGLTAAFGWNAAGPVVLLAALAAGVTALLLPAALQREPGKDGSPGRARNGDVQY